MTNRDGTNDEDKGASKGKRHHMVSVTRGMSWENITFKGKINTKIIELMVVHKKEWGHQRRPRIGQCSDSGIARILWRPE